MTQPTNIQAEMARRAELLAKCSSSLDFQAIIREMCRKDINYFFDNFLYTDKNKTIYGSDWDDLLPFIPYEFQREYINEVRESIVEGNKPVKERKPWVLTNVFVEKSRQMWISWVTCWIFVYWFIFHKHKYTVISRTSDEVDKSWDMDSIFEKLRFMIRHLPDWMIPEWFSKEPWKDKTNSYMNISDPNSQASITGKTANKDAWRWGTRNAIFMDEMAFMQYATEINRSAWQASPCLIYNSTPNWMWNEFYRIRTMTMPQRSKSSEIIPPQIKGLRYHRRDHPLYDDEWYKWKTQGKTKEQIAQEYEIDYNIAVVGRVYPEFNSSHSDIKYDQSKPLYVWIDNSHGGTDPNAIIVAQTDGLFYDIIDCIEVYTTPENCANFLAWTPKHLLSDDESEFLKRYMTYNWKRAIFVSDPYDTMSAMWNSTIYDDYRKVWINLCIPQERKKVVQIRTTRTNIYRFRFSENAYNWANSIMNSKYPTRWEQSQSTSETTLPVHDWTSHYRTATEYWATYIAENPILNKVKDNSWLSDRPANEYGVIYHQ